jgi:mannose-6-phosphate isomerase-like protein (cupin superfamily)
MLSEQKIKEFLGVTARQTFARLDRIAEELPPAIIGMTDRFRVTLLLGRYPHPSGAVINNQCDMSVSVLVGSVRLLIGIEIMDVRVGQTVLVPKGVGYAWQTLSEELPVLLVESTPYWFEQQHDLLP